MRLGVGGTPSSAERTGRLGLPVPLGVLLGGPEKAKPLTDLYWRAGEEAGHPREALSVGTVSHFHVGATSQFARDTFYPTYRNWLSDGRGIQIPRASFDTMTEPHGALMVGSPQDVIDKLMLEHELFGLDRFMGQVDLGGLPRSDVLRSIELSASDVAPTLRRELA